MSETMSKPWQKTKGVRFNTRNPAERRLYEYIEGIDSFSSFVKHLITNHLASGWETKDAKANYEVKRNEKPPSQSVTKGVPYDI